MKLKSPLIIMCNVWCLCSQGDIAEQEGDSQSQGSTTWLVDPKESKRTISTKYETTIFWADPSSSWPGLTLLPSLLLCAFSLWLSPLEAPPPTSPSFLSCHHLCLHLKTTRCAAANQQPLACSCSPLPHTLLQSADFINPLPAASPHSSSLLLTSYPPCVLLFLLLSHYRFSVIRRFSWCFSCSARRRPLWGFTLIFRLQVLEKMWLATPKSGPLHTSCNWEDIFTVEN